MLVGGLFVGVVVRWLVISAPPLPVTASEADHSPGMYSSTNAIFLPARALAQPPPG